MRIRSNNMDDAEVPLSPLIDCVFLLLIFFLVTMMLKRWEYQILLDVPDTTASLTVTKDEEIVDLRLDAAGNLYADTGLRDARAGGDRTYELTPLDVLPYLKDLAATNEQGVDVPIVIRADRETNWQTYLRIQDILALQGFNNVALALREQRKESAGDK